MQCNGVKGFYARLTGKDPSLFYLSIYLYVYIYRCSVTVCKTFKLD